MLNAGALAGGPDRARSAAPNHTFAGCHGLPNSQEHLLLHVVVNTERNLMIQQAPTNG
jgi:hypothetical protein